MISVELVVLVITALVFDFWNGLHDSSNVVATIISSRAMGPRTALWMAALANGIGPFLFGLHVAETIGKLITDEVAEAPDALTVVLAALAGAIVWNIITWFFGIPSSSSHALIGGLVGAALASHGIDGVSPDTLIKAALALFISPVAGLAAGYLMVRLFYYFGQYATPHVNKTFRRGQVVASVWLALSHGTNDAQKTMGIITLALVITGNLQEFEVPVWVVLISASAIAAGTLFGGQRLIRTLGGKFYKVRPIHGLGAQTASAGVILAASFLGGPVSTTHVVSSAIIGAGSAERARQVRWGVARNIVVAWFLTIPLSALVAAVAYQIIINLIG